MAASRSFATLRRELDEIPWNFFKRRQVAVGGEEATVVKVEAPVGSTEAYVVELGPYKDRDKLAGVLTQLKARGFIEQEIRVTPD